MVASDMPSIAWDEYDNAKPGVGPADAEGISNGYDHEKPPDDNPTSHFAESDNGVAVYVPDGPDGPAANANVTPAAATGATPRDPAETVVVAAVVVVDPNGATVVVVENTVVETGVVVELVNPDRATFVVEGVVEGVVVEGVVVEGAVVVEGVVVEGVVVEGAVVVAGTVVVEEGAIPPGGRADEGAAGFVFAAAGTTSRARISPLTMSFVKPGTTTGATSQRDTDGANEQSPSWTSCNRSSQCPPNELRSDR